MRFIADSLQSIAVTLWAGGIWIVGLLVAPFLFHILTDRTQAGLLAGHLFTVISWMGLGCGAYLLLYRLAIFGSHALRQLFFWALVAMLALDAIGQFGVQPIMAGLRREALPKEVMESIFRDRFATWHGVASVLYLIECVLGLVLVVQHGRGR
ncbi:MAG TPA: DUF4149 domain-containing protein [Burkholderiales bacterium]|nr:DUF4149 domain-containing protein [Burkholderiales bacterium]